MTAGSKGRVVGSMQCSMLSMLSWLLGRVGTWARQRLGGRGKRAALPLRPPCWRVWTSAAARRAVAGWVVGGWVVGRERGGAWPHGADSCKAS